MVGGASFRASSVYRELNIMNRVSNKGFALKSYKQFSKRSFSDVFCPASGMQSGCGPKVHNLARALAGASERYACPSLAGVRMRSGTAC